MKPYQIQFCGSCLGELVPNGTTLRADPTAPIAPMDMVSIVLKRVDGPFGAFMNAMGGDFAGVCKLYLGSQLAADGERIHLVAQLAPPALSPIPESAIAAMHRVVDGSVSPDAPTGMSLDDQAAIALLLPFARDGHCLPIAPAWNPADYVAVGMEATR